MTDFFKDIPTIAYEGPDSTSDFAFHHYDPTEMLNGKSMAEHLRFSVAYWHSFAWPGGDPFGGQTFDRPWFDQGSGDTMDLAKLKADVAFEMFRILGQPYFCWHDADIRPEADTFAESRARLEEIIDYIGEKMEATGTKCLWGTANLFSNRRFMAGAATNPDPDVFAYCAATVKACLDGTKKLGGENYVLWGGREGYETLLNTDLTREREQAGRFLCMVVDYAKKIGFDGTILIEPKPQEPTKHQYDYDTATVYGFLKDFGLENEVKVNIEQGHAILAGHSFEHELAMAASLGTAFLKTRPELATPDIQFHIQPFSADNPADGPHKFDAFTASVLQMRPESAGHIELKSPDPSVPVGIHPNYLATKTDCDTIVAGIQIARKIAEHDPLKSMVTEEHAPGPDVAFDDYDATLNWARDTAVTIYHPTGTCKMGIDDKAVVDPRLKVKGIDGLRVADASIMPQIVSGNTNAPCIMIGEKAARENDRSISAQTCERPA